MERMSEGENRRVVVMVKGRDAVPNAQYRISGHQWRSGQGQEVRCTLVEVLRKNSRYRGCSVESRCLVLRCVVLFSC